MKSYLAALIIVSLCFYLILKSKWIWMINQAKQKGLYPSKGKPTMFHVRQLLISGQKDLAVRVYCQIFFLSPDLYVSNQYI